MRGGKAPIHIMRFAPADYVNDPAVRLALAKRDFVASTFYPLFLFHSVIQGGSLPSDVVLLAATIGLRASDVKRAISFWIEHGKIHEENGRLYQKRVRREVEEELAFREAEAERKRIEREGKRPPDVHRTSAGRPPESDAPAPLAGAVGRRRAPSAMRQAPDTGRDGSAAPPVENSDARPADDPARPSRSNGRVAVTDTTAAEVDTLAAELAAICPDVPAEEWVARASRIEADAHRPAKSFRRPREPGVSEPWARTTVRKLTEFLEQARRPLPL